MANKEKPYDNNELYSTLNEVTYNKITKEAKDLVIRVIKENMPKSSKNGLPSDEIFYLISKNVEISTQSIQYYSEIFRAEKNEKFLGKESIKKYKAMCITVAKALQTAINEDDLQILKDGKKEGHHYATEEEWKKLTRMAYNGRSKEEMIAFLLSTMND